MTIPQVGADEYAAQEISPALLMGIVDKLQAADASNLDYSGIPTSLSADEFRALRDHMLVVEAAERFPIGDYDMLGMRFICRDRPYTLLAVLDYSCPYPVLVDGHITCREDAINAWLGDAEAEDHPDLYLC